jgi:hypothetical protein
MESEEIGGRPSTAKPPGEDGAHYSGTVAELNVARGDDKDVSQIIDAAIRRLNLANQILPPSAYVTPPRPILTQRRLDELLAILDGRVARRDREHREGRA